ncbi:MAG: DUF456 domain-containing protein [Planctomycetota bacterium]|nr:DUF456 domain-containing protein [Planctomycetota bacterium]
MLESLSEHSGLFYYLLQCIMAIIGLVVVSIGLPGQFLPGVVALAIWLLGWRGESEEMQDLGLEVGILLGAAVTAEVIEFLSGWIGGKTVGASRQGSIGAVIGGLVGGISGNLIVPLLGGLIGVLVGTFVGAYLGEKRWLEQQVRAQNSVDASGEQPVVVGLASLVGRALGLIAKISVILMIGLYFFVQCVLLLW